MPSAACNSGTKEEGQENLLHQASSESQSETENSAVQVKKRHWAANRTILRVVKKLKMILPHVVVTVLIFGYIGAGAAVIQWLENRYLLENFKSTVEANGTLASASGVLIAIERAVGDAIRLCAASSDSQCKMAKALVNELLKDALDPCAPKSPEADQWSYEMAFLYALTVITTTGYDQVSPTSTTGRWFTIMFGLFGIPLMLLIIANLGVFLSECVRTIGRWMVKLKKWLDWPIFQEKPTKELNGSVFNCAVGGNCKAALLLPKTNRRRVTSVVCFVLFFYVGLILFYCFVSSQIFMLFETEWSTIHGMFFSFNSISTIGLGPMRWSDDWFVFVVVVHNVLGLAVLTMCVNLASKSFKILFLKLHYVGRKIRDIRTLFDTMSNEMVDVMRVVLKLMTIKATRGVITLDDIQELLESVKSIRFEPIKAFVPNDAKGIPFMDD